MELRRPHLLYLELDPDADPVTGRVWREGAERRPFTGYASLIATIEALRAGEPRTAQDRLERP